jgi:hypothetical protein
MKNTIKMALLVAGLSAVTSCSRYFAPPFTDVSKVSQLKSGMKIKQVSDVLGIDPYDVYYMQETGAQLYSFNYRLKNRVMYLYKTMNRMEVDRQTSDENSQKAGEVYYDKNYRQLYVMFNAQGDLTSYLTTSGEKDKRKLVVIGNTIKFYDDKNTTFVDSLYNKAFNPSYGNRPIRINFDRFGDFSDNEGESTHEKRRGLFRRKSNK